MNRTKDDDALQARRKPAADPLDRAARTATGRRAMLKRAFRFLRPEQQDVFLELAIKVLPAAEQRFLLNAAIRAIPELCRRSLVDAAAGTPEPDATSLPLLDRLRRIRATIDPSRIYRETEPDGSIFEGAGADLIATADEVIALLDAIRRDEPIEVGVALKRLLTIS
jgi:hypothetical protein